jgi:hypothetical protein
VQRGARPMKLVDCNWRRLIRDGNSIENIGME